MNYYFFMGASSNKLREIDWYVISGNNFKDAIKNNIKQEINTKKEHNQEYYCYVLGYDIEDMITNLKSYYDEQLEFLSKYNKIEEISEEDIDKLTEWIYSTVSNYDFSYKIFDITDQNDVKEINLEEETI